LAAAGRPNSAETEHVALESNLLMAGLIFLLVFAVAAQAGDLEKARDAQDRVSLDKLLEPLAAAAQKQSTDPAALYRLALGNSYLSEVALEVRDKNQAHAAADAGMAAAERAVAMKPDSAEYHRVLGVLCGQEVSSLPLMSALRYGRCALDEVNKALQIDSKSSINFLSRGVGNYYLPPAFGGGTEPALKDFQKAIELNPQSAEAHLWLGMTLRKVNRNAEARKEFQKAIELNPARVWAKQQLDKTPLQ